MSGKELCRAKVHLPMASGDIPAVAEMMHHSEHTSVYGCRICKAKGRHSLNSTNGMYFVDINSMMRTKSQLKNGNLLYKIAQKSLFAELPSFSGVSFFGLDEMHLIAHGIGKHVYELIMANTKGSSNIFYTDENKRQKKDNYTFHFTAEEIKKMGEALEQSRSTIPTSFQGSWDNIFAKIDEKTFV
ncbi:hypothetical protein G6F56_013365 [Rhizopus delemar]|nr:hypothetical protein G6F56_013365 [Rhizopus delemar]